MTENIYLFDSLHFKHIFNTVILVLLACSIIFIFILMSIVLIDILDDNSKHVAHA